MTELTERETLILQAALSYLLSNREDVNDAFEDFEDVSKINVCGISTSPFKEREIVLLSHKLNIPVVD